MQDVISHLVADSRCISRDTIIIIIIIIKVAGNSQSSVGDYTRERHDVRRYCKVV